MARKNLNLQSALTYTMGLSNARLDGLYFELVDKLAALKIKADKTAAADVPPDPDNKERTGNIGAIVEWVRSVEPPVLRDPPGSVMKEKDPAGYDALAAEAKKYNARMQELFAEDIKNLKTLHASIRQKMRNSGYDPTRPNTDTSVEALKQREVEAQQAADAAARKQAIARETAKAAALR